MQFYEFIMAFSIVREEENTPWGAKIEILK